MKVAIHHNPGSFSDRWIAYCKENCIPYKLVNAYDTDIIQQIEDCDAFMWHHRHDRYSDLLFAKQMLFSLQEAGKKVFPDYNTCWHFDDKVGQKYLLESLKIPMVPSYVFYDKSKAKEWLEGTTFPKVFKLRGGAGSSNVILVKNKRKGKRLVSKAFGRGFKINKISLFTDELKRYRNGHSTIRKLVLRLGNIFISTTSQKMFHRERGYVYFQEFVPNNDSDTRVIVIGDKAYAIKRRVRKNDFRASGSGEIEYDHSHIDLRCISTSFKAAAKLNTQCIAFDYVHYDEEPLIVEISYGFSTYSYDACDGYWDSSLQWHKEKFNPQFWMIENLIK